MIDGWNSSITKSNNDCFYYHTLLRSGEIKIEKTVSKYQSNISKFRYDGWLILYVESYNKCILPFDFNFDYWDLYNNDGMAQRTIKAYIFESKTMPKSFRLLRKDELEMVNILFPNSNGKNILYEDNKDTYDVKLALLVADADSK